MLDVDCKDRSLGISCPPPSFVESSFIHSLKECLTTNGTFYRKHLQSFSLLRYFFCVGLFLMNLVCRNETRRNDVLEMLRESFASVQLKKIKGEVNEIITCHPSLPSSKASGAKKMPKKWWIFIMAFIAVRVFFYLNVKLHLKLSFTLLYLIVTLSNPCQFFL